MYVMYKTEWWDLNLWPTTLGLMTVYRTIVAVMATSEFIDMVAS